MPSNDPDNIRTMIERGELDAAARTARNALPGLEGEARGQMLLLLSWAQLSAGHQQEALRHAATAIEVFDACGSVEGRCDALIRIGNVLRGGGDHAGALTTLEQAEVLARTLGEPTRIAAVLRAIGVCCSIIGRHQHALSCLQESLELLANAGTVTERLGTRQSLLNAINRRIGTPATDDVEAAAVLAQQIEKWGELAEDCAATGHTRLEVMARGNLAITLYESGRADAAIAALTPLLARYRELGMRPNEAICHNELGRCFEARCDAASAQQHYERAIALLRDGGSLDDLQQALDGLSRTQETLGDLAQALAALREVRAIDTRKADEAARASASQRELRIELARLTSQWARQATQDPLTGLGNRRALDRWLGEYLPRVEHGESLILMLMDLDNFKQVNDSFGHDIGDEVLRQVSRVMQQHCRTGDLAVRYGGEEFLLAMVGLSGADALAAAQRLRLAVADVGWGELRAGLVVTVSIGLTEAHEAHDGPALLTLADRRLYAAKFGGRNRVVAG